MKAEKLKQPKQIFRKVWISHFEHSKETDEQLEIICESHDYIFEAMEQYAAEVSRERAIDFAGFYYDSVAEEFFCDWMNMDRADFLPGDFYFIKCMMAFAKQSCEWQKQICQAEVDLLLAGFEDVCIKAPLPIIFDK